MLRVAGVVALLTVVGVLGGAGVAGAADTTQTCASSVACVGDVVHADNLVTTELVHVDTVHVFG